MLPEIRIAYQPVIDFAQRRVVGYEALLRVDGVAPPEVFRKAREGGEEIELDVACVQTAIMGAAGFAPGQRLFVNLSPATVQALARAEVCLVIPPGAPPLVFELPEQPGWGDESLDWERLRAMLNRFGEIALDDVGEGFQDLRRLRLLRPGWLKVARGLVDKVDGDAEGRAILRSLCILARGLGARVVAEGVETQAEWATCRNLGVGYGQGFLFGRPVTRGGDRVGVVT